MNNIKLSKQLVKIAKSLVAVDDENNIDVTCFYDSDIAYDDRNSSFDFYFCGGRQFFLAVEKDLTPKDVFQIYDLEELGYNKIDSYNALPFEKIKQIIKRTGNLDEINKNYHKIYDDDDQWEFEDFKNIDEFLENIKEQYVDDIMENLLNDETVSEIVEASKSYFNIPDFDDIYYGKYEDYGLQLKDGYSFYVSRGYSQGDRLDVIYKTGSFTETMIDHILWDIPLICYVTINGDEYYIDEYMKDQYEYDKNEALEICKKIIPDFEQYQEKLKELLPEQPEYY